MGSFLLLAFLLLIAGVIAVPLASKLGLGSVLGYLIAGIVLGPVLLALNVDVVSLQHFAEFGVVMMLFLVGLELEPKRLWEMRAKLLGLGGLQVGLTAALAAGAAMVFGLPWSFAVAIGLVLALSSTAIVLQTLNEKGLMRSEGGQAGFSVLLFQDIAVIPMLALIPLLAMPDLVDSWSYVDTGHVAEIAAPLDAATSSHNGTEATGGGSNHDVEGSLDLNLVDGLPGWAQALVTLGAIGAVIAGGSYLTRPLFRFIELAHLRELFVAAALMMVIGIALLMTLVGLSPALGTFLAGVVLANSEYRHELESDIDPFRGLLLGLFFMTVGAGINFGLLFGNLALVIGLTLGLMALKGGVLYLLASVFGVRGSDRWLVTLGLAQAGEFGFVLLSLVVANQVLPPAIADQLLLVVALSMLLTPVLFILFDRVIVPKYVEDQAREADEITEAGTVVIAGHGRFGGIINRILRQAGISTVVLDHSSQQLEMLRAFGLKVFYGDATRPDLLHAAGIAGAKVLVIAIDDKEGATEMTRYVTQNHPQVHIIARARDRNHVYDLYAAGCRDIIRDTFDSAVRSGRSALEALGVHPFDAELQTRDFEERDRYSTREMAALYDPEVEQHRNAAYVKRARELMAEQEAMLLGKPGAFAMRADRGWSPPTARDVAAEEGG
jgi:glutathione-regulated potassium-efflux system protein KefB